MDAFLYDTFYRIERTHWWSVGMRCAFAALLDGALSDGGRWRLLDVGCGTGITMECFGAYGRVVGVDVAREAVAYCKQRNASFDVCQADGLHLPLAPASFDAALVFDVIEHLADDGAGVGEVYRVVRPGGVALFNVPAFQSLWSGKDTANHHYRRYTTRSLREVLEGAGFVCERLTYTNATMFPPIWLLRQLQRKRDQAWDSDGEYNPNPLVNTILTGVLRAESAVLRHVSLPWGTSATCLARRPPR